jgi:hypothetical protein
MESACADHTEPVLKLSAGGNGLEFPVWIYNLPESMVETMTQNSADTEGPSSEGSDDPALSNKNNDGKTKKKKKNKKKSKGKDDPGAKLLLLHGRRLASEHPQACHVLILGDKIACAVAPTTQPSTAASSPDERQAGGECHNIVACGGAGQLLGRVLKRLGGRGGGGPDFAAGSLPSCEVCLDTLGATFAEAAETK